MILPTFSKKTHEIKNFLGRGGGARAVGAPLDPPLFLNNNITVADLTRAPSQSSQSSAVFMPYNKLAPSSGNALLKKCLINSIQVNFFCCFFLMIFVRNYFG